LTKCLSVLMIVLVALSLFSSVGFVRGFNACDAMSKGADTETALTTEASSAQTRISISPSCMVMPVGSNITVAVTLANVTGLWLWQVAIEYDASVVTCSEVCIPENNVFSSWEAPSPLINAPATNGLSFILAGAREVGNATVDVTTGIMFNINFTAMNDGETAIRIATTQNPIHPGELTDWYSFLCDYDLGEMSYIEDNGMVTVGATNVTVFPTPDVGLTFDNVTGTGSVTANKKPTVQAPPLNDTIGPFIELSITVKYSGNITVSVAYGSWNITSQQGSIVQSMMTPQQGSLALMMITPIPGDIRKPWCQVDMRDIGNIAIRFLTDPTSPLWDPAADITGPEYLVPDGRVDMRDIGFVARNFGGREMWIDVTTWVDSINKLLYGVTRYGRVIGVIQLR